MQIYQNEDLEFVRKAINRGVFYKDFMTRCNFSQEELTAMFQQFRKERFRVFLTQKTGEEYFAAQKEYMELNKINDAIYNDGSPLKIVVIADTHFGSKLDNPSIMDKIYNYCIETGTSHIIHLGDVVEGDEYHVLYGDEDELRYKISDDSQIRYLEKVIPYDKSITLHILEGNHDLYTNNGIANDVLYRFVKESSRSDIHIVGYDFASLKINDDVIYLNHGVVKDSKSGFVGAYDNNLVLCGHSHMSKHVDEHNGLILEHVPSLSNIKHGNDPTSNYVGFISLDIYFNDNKEIDYIIKRNHKFSNVYHKPVCIGGKSETHVRRLTK